ncbi:MAG TPA: NAD-binding protein, partial [Roseiflexaceae bacterium]|nr:NAD-binding protein [Roseiflexaceae bacterium]
LFVTAIGTLYLRVFYDPCRYDGNADTNGCYMHTGEALFETLKLQTLQSGLPLPIDSLLGEALFFFTPLVGLALLFQGVLNFGRLLLDKGSRREAWQIALASTYSDHVIVCGLGRVGFRTVRQLIEAGSAPVVIEHDWQSEFVEAAINAGVPVVVGDAREPTTLRRAGLGRARAIVAAIHDDLVNIEIALTVRSLEPDVRVILRVFNDELDANLERALGRNTAFSASALAAPTYAAAAVSREVALVIHSNAVPLALTHITVSPQSRLAGLVRSRELEYDMRVLHLKPGNGRHLAPTPQTQLIPHDNATLLGTIAALEHARALNESDKPNEQVAAQQHISPQYSTVIVCGLGKVGYRVVRQLHAMNPRPRIVVVRLSGAPNDFPQRISQLAGIETVEGDARELDVLRRAGIDTAFSVAALTSDDLLNLQIGLAARQLRPDIHIVVRAFSDTLADQLAELFDIRTAYSTSALASPTLAAAALIGDISHGFAIEGRLHSVDTQVVQAGSVVVGRSVEQIRT